MGNWVYVNVNGQISPVGPVQGAQMAANAAAQGIDVSNRLFQISNDNLVQLPGGAYGVHNRGTIYALQGDASSAYIPSAQWYKPVSTSILQNGQTLSGQQITNNGLSPWSNPNTRDNLALNGSWAIDAGNGYQRVSNAEDMKNVFYNNIDVRYNGATPYLSSLQNYQSQINKCLS